MALRIALVFVVIGAGVSTAAAQRAAGFLTVGAGSATDITGVRSRAATASAAGVVSPLPQLTLGGGLNGTRFDAGQWAATAGVTTSVRSSSGPLALTVDGAGDFTATSYDISYLTGSVSPGVELGTGPFIAFGGIRASRAAITLPALIDDPLPPLGREGGASRRSVRGGMTAVAGATAGWSMSAARFTLRLTNEQGTVAAASHRERRLEALASHGLLSLSGLIARREAGDNRDAYASGAMSVALTQSTSLSIAAGGYPANRLTGAAAGRFVSAALSLRVAPSRPALPRPASVPPVARGMTRLAIAAPDAQRVEVAGDFNRWTAAPARRAANGVWYVDLRLSPGEYRYAFRVDGTEWRVPSGARTADDDFGGKSAWITVHAEPGRDTPR